MLFFFSGIFAVVFLKIFVEVILVVQFGLDDAQKLLSKLLVYE